MFDITGDIEPAKNLAVISRLDEAIPLVALSHVARFMCASLTCVPAKAALFSSSFSSSFSLLLSVSLSSPYYPSSHLSRPHPREVHHSHHRTSSFHLVSHLSSTLDRVCAVQPPRKVFVWRFRRGCLFSCHNPISYPPHHRPLFPLREHPEGWTRDEIFWRIPFQISLYALIAQPLKTISSVINERIFSSCVDEWKLYRSRATNSPLFLITDNTNAIHVTVQYVILLRLVQRWLFSTLFSTLLSPLLSRSAFPGRN